LREVKMPEEKSYYTYEIPLDGKRTHVGGGWVPDFEETRKYKKLSPVDFEILSYRGHVYV
jgi:hypothetical protein